MVLGGCKDKGARRVQGSGLQKGAGIREPGGAVLGCQEGAGIREPGECRNRVPGGCRN